MRGPSPSSLSARVAAVDWVGVEAALDAEGCAVVDALFTPDECAMLSDLYERPELFRKRVVMARHGFGQGQYQYFDYPLPKLVAEARRALYSRLVSTANRWQAALRLEPPYPETHEGFVERCHAAGQQRPTPLLLAYEQGDYNCLHQDLYGEHVFPLQVAVLLSQPGRDFTGGEFVLTEQRPRRQSRPMVLPLSQGSAAIVAVHQRPVQGTRGPYRVQHRHGVSRLRSGRRHTLGIIFHDAT